MNMHVTLRSRNRWPELVDDGTPPTVNCPYETRSPAPGTFGPAVRFLAERRMNPELRETDHETNSNSKGVDMFKKPLGLLGVFLIIVGIGYFIGAGVAFSKTQGGYGSLEAFSAAQNVELSFNEDGQLIDRGTTEGAEAIMQLLEDDWDFPVVEGCGSLFTPAGICADDPVVNNQSEYMYQMATIVYHTLHGTQMITLSQDDIDAAIASEQLGPDGTYNGVVEAYQGQVLEPDVAYEVPVDERYWTDFNRMDVLDGRAREGAWSGTAHALVAALGVGAATHSALQLALGIAGLLAGLGVVCMVMGIAFIWHTRRTMFPDTVPQEMVQEHKEMQKA
jgi:hypothetical protein